MKVQNPIIGRSRGSAGGMTFCKVYDKNVARAKAFDVTNPKTAAQTTQRNYFKELTAVVATFPEEQLRFLFPNKPKAMSRRNALAKQLAEYFTQNAGVKSVDYASIDTIGNASTLQGLQATAIADANNVAISLVNTNIIPDELQNNYFAALVINVTKGQVFLPISTAVVNKTTFSIVLPENWEESDTYKAIPLVTNTQTVPVGFGTMFVVKRPTKANA